jgi:phospholipase/lecithinase/hemolysin
MRRALLALASVSALLTAACGSGTIESQLQPTRVLAFGDGLSDLGQGGTRYTVNDANINIWTQQVAASFGYNLASAAAGGTSWALGNVRIAAKPDAAGNGATPTVTEQIDAFLASGAVGANDLVMVGGGTGDIVAEMAKVMSGAQSGDQMLANVQQAGRDLAAQVRRLVAAGATHVVVSGTYNLGRSPWATGLQQVDLLTQASSKFNEEMLVSIVDLGANVLYVDMALLYNLMIGVPTAYGMTNSTDPVCTSVDPGPGIGIGAGQVNSALCTPATVLPGVNYNEFLFADRIYPAPQAQRKFGEYAFTRIRARW